MGNKQKSILSKRANLKRLKEQASDLRFRKKMKIDTSNMNNNGENFIRKKIPVEQNSMESSLHDNIITIQNRDNVKIKIQLLKNVVMEEDYNQNDHNEKDFDEQGHNMILCEDMHSSANNQNKRTLLNQSEVGPTLSPISPLLETYQRSTKDEDNNFELNGHRIIDVSHFFKELIKISAHESLFQCGLHTMKVKSEKINSFLSQFWIQCNMCKKEFKIQTSEQKLNKLAVAGVIAAGCGHAQLKQISASLDIPIMSEHTYKVSQDEVFDEWKVTAWESMKIAGQREREAALKENKVDKNGIPIIDVILDGCWCKRSYRTNYSALSGAAAIIGRRFGQVLFMAVKNKYCCICARADKVNEQVKQHECYKNFDGSSTAMESTIIAEGFKKSIEMHGLIYSRFIADGDSSTYSKILETRPYLSVTVEKIGCKNHILRNFCTKLQQLKTDTKYAIKDRQLLTNSKILCSRKFICDSIKYHGAQQNDKSINVSNLHKDIVNAMYHSYGFHDKCNKNICQELTQIPDVKKNFNTQLFQQISYLSQNCASQARSLIENVDSNVVERLNGVIAKFVGGKRVNYALKRAYQARCAGAVVSFNTRKILTAVHKTIHKKSPHLQIKKFENNVESKRAYNQTLKRKKNRKLFPKKINFDYGENAKKPDMTSETYELSKASFLESLKKTTAERHEIEQRTILQSESGEWLELRRNLLTASNFGKIIKRKKTNACDNIVKNLLYKANISHVASIHHGNKYESIALEQLSRLQKINIQPCGLFIDSQHPFLGATPDGVSDDMIVEVKCPLAPFKMGIDAAIKENKMHFWKVNKNTGLISINKKSDWYFQVQGQLHISKKDKCLLAVWYGQNKIKTEIIERDDKFWSENMEPQLISFYFDCLLPELVDPRHPRNMPMRNPAYVIKKIVKRNVIIKKNSSEKKLQENK